MNIGDLKFCWSATFLQSCANKHDRLQLEMCMGIIVANGPALKVWYDIISRHNFWPKSWPESLPRLRVVWRSKTVRASLSDHVPRISTLQVSGFHITQFGLKTETQTTLGNTESDYELNKYGWSNVVHLREKDSDIV
jgi:hypothetical protein